MRGLSLLLMDIKLALLWPLDGCQIYMWSKDFRAVSVRHNVSLKCDMVQIYLVCKCLKLGNKHLVVTSSWPKQFSGHPLDGNN